MSDREIVYRLKIMPDAGSANVLRNFGRDIQRMAIGGGGGSSGAAGIGGATGGIGGNIQSIIKETEKMAQGVVDAAKKGQGPLADMYRKMADEATDAAHEARKAQEQSLDAQMRKLSDFHNKRLAIEEKSTAAFNKEYSKQVAAFEKAERAKAAAADAAAQRIHDRHRIRQRSIAMQNRRMRESLEDLPDYEGMGPVDRGDLDRPIRSGLGAGRSSRGAMRSGNILGGAGRVISGLGFIGSSVGVEGSDDLIRALAIGHGVKDIAGGAGMLLGGVGGGAAAAGGPIAAGAAAAASVAVAAKVISESLDGSATKLDSWTVKIAESEVGVAQWIGKTTGWFDLLGGSTERLSRTMQEGAARQERIAAHSQANESLFRMRGEISGIRADAFAAGDTSRGAAMGLNARRQDDVLRELSRARSDQTFRAGESQDKFAERAAGAKQRELESQKQLIGLLREQQGLQRELTSEVLKERDAYRQVRDEALNKLTDARARFGELDPEEQQRAIRARRQLTDSRFFGGRGGPSREDRDLLRRVGDETTNRDLRAFSSRLGQQAGFDTAFGQEQRNAAMFADQAQRALTNLAINIQPQQNIEVKIEQNLTVLTDAITAKVDAALRVYQQMVEKEITRSLQERLRKTPGVR